MNAIRVKIALSLVVLFGLGAATGVVAARKLAPQPAAAPATLPVEERWSKTRFEEYRSRLNLTPAQVAAIAPHFREFGQEMRQVRDELRGRYVAALRNLNERVSSELTLEQRQEMRELLQERWHRRDNAPRNP